MNFVLIKIRGMQYGFGVLNIKSHLIYSIASALILLQEGAEVELKLF